MSSAPGPPRPAEEWKTLKRLLYKNKNQHRRTSYYRCIDSALRASAPLLASSETSSARVQASRRARETLANPSREVFLRETQDVISPILSELAESAENAFAAQARYFHAVDELAALARQGYFLPFVVVAMASASVLAQELEKRMMDALGEFKSLADGLVSRARFLFSKASLEERERVAVAVTRVLSQTQSGLSNGLLQKINAVEWEEKKPSIKAAESVAASGGDDDDLGETVAAESTIEETTSNRVKKKAHKEVFNATKTHKKTLRESIFVDSHRTKKLKRDHT